MKKFIVFGVWIVLICVTLYWVVGAPPAKVEKPLELPLASTVNNPYSHLEGYETLVRLQHAFVTNARKIKPAVVSINNLTEISNPHSQRDLMSGEPGTWFSNFRYWLKRTFRKRYQMESLGSGLIFDEAGYIVTNYHVVEKANRLLVKFLDNREYTAQVVGVDPKTDLAVVKVFSLSRFQKPEFGSSSKIEVGDWVMAIGNPYGLTGTITVGVVSGKGRIDLGIATFENFLQTDTSINPGNSGGPLIDMQGRVIGINTAIAELGSGVGFAIPMETVEKVARDLIENGEVERGWLGIGIQHMTPDMAESFRVPRDQNGVVVNSIDEGAPADKAGLRQGDIIIAYDGKDIAHPQHLQNYVADTKVGETVKIKILRDGLEQTLEVKIGKYFS
ncbi:Serine endoprotease [Nitrospina gracilis 3/211]|uniref:Serine endoprotease n=1 Tax=Nitrospina gracilis (strain 3/211) TaxID=1266370 RepID=M1Z1D7_NITG3|nr:MULTISPECIES: trypsin-like peptidase domain-containing protein [Nitrospina]MCF8724385.1 serine protease Do [Nitrospina sp. Nb-3]CCQ91540.1 Serine endoprotease [Nitrospina gracilis 3/211]